MKLGRIWLVDCLYEVNLNIVVPNVAFMKLSITRLSLSLKKAAHEILDDIHWIAMVAV